MWKSGKLRRLFIRDTLENCRDDIYRHNECVVVWQNVAPYLLARLKKTHPFYAA
jgi:hypothetical protein